MLHVNWINFLGNGKGTLFSLLKFVALDLTDFHQGKGEGGRGLVVEGIIYMSWMDFLLFSQICCKSLIM